MDETTAAFTAIPDQIAGSAPPVRARHAAMPHRDTTRRPAVAAPPGYRHVPVATAGDEPATAGASTVAASAAGRAADRAQQAWGVKTEAASQATALQQALPGLRRQIVERLHDLNWTHARTAWERRRKDPISAHALVLLFADPANAADPAEPSGYGLKIGCRTFFATDEPRLAYLLHEMATITTAHLAAGRDPRIHVANWHDPMSSQATYLGLAVSSLDTPETSWTQAQQDARSDMDLPGRCYTTLADHSRMLLDRKAITNFGDLTITTTVKPDYDSAGQLHRRWRYDPDLTDRSRLTPTDSDIWDRLDHLHTILLRGHHAH